MCNTVTRILWYIMKHICLADEMKSNKMIFTAFNEINFAFPKSCFFWGFSEYIDNKIL